MAETSRSVHPRQYLRSLRCHVLSPFETALETVDRETAAVEAERRAFEEFSDRVADIDSEAVPSRPCGLRTTGPSGAIQRVRDAYRETVMDVDHYGREYGERLVENVRGEFGPDIASSLHPERSSSFTAGVKQAIVAAADRRAAARASFRTCLEDERRSVASARREVADVVGSLDSSRVPHWYRSTFLDRLDELAAVRQETIRSRNASGDLDGHGFCEYLYGRTRWTYPVLAALGRLRGAVVV